MPRTFPSAQALAADCIFLTGFAVIDGASAITSQSATGATLTYDGGVTNTFTLTLDETYAEFCGITADCIEVTPTANHLHVISETVTAQATREIKFIYSVDAAPGTGVAVVDSILHWTVSLRDTARGTTFP